MTNTWQRSPGAQPPHQQHVRRFGGNVRQRSASSALRLPQGGSRAGAPALDAASGGTRTRKRKATAIVLHEHCRLQRFRSHLRPAFFVATSNLQARAARRTTAAVRQRWRSHGGAISNCGGCHKRCTARLDRPSVAPPILNSRKERCRSRRVDGRSIAPPIPELKQRALPLFQAAGPAFSCTADS
eukprot:SM000047S16816  [mRNA]  locus=s47:37151:38273:+ [translate_table: standard]